MTEASGLPQVRPAHTGDIPQVRSLLYLGSYTYFFMGWDPLERWPGREPFWVLTRGTLVSAAMAAPLDTEETAWLRLFALQQGLRPETAWAYLWPAMRDELRQRGVRWVMALGLYPWLEDLYQDAGFQEDVPVVTLHWQGGQKLVPMDLPGITLRPVRQEDLPSIAHLDARSFAPRWRVGEQALRLVLPYLLLGLVAEQEGRIVGYLLVMETPRGGHITRLGVLPEMRGRGIGRMLVHNALATLTSQGCTWVTVNTQRDNEIALRLYASMGFRETRQIHRVWCVSLHEAVHPHPQEEQAWVSQPLP